jgi:hypothetical protein
VDRTPETDLSIPANLGLPLTSSGNPSLGQSGTIAGSVLPLRRAEELIVTLPGVLSVRIVPNETGAIDEVHVLTTDAVPPKNTVRNIESALMAQLGLRVNHRKISVATTLDAPRAADQAPERVAERQAERQVERSADRVTSRQPEVAYAPQVATSSAMETPVREAPVPRDMPMRAGSRLSEATQALSAVEGRRVLIFEDVEVRRSRSKGVLCRVTLSREQSHYVGESEGQESERSRVELAARAALSAISQAASASAGGERSVALEGAKLMDAFDREFVFVSVTARIGREMVVLTGSCEVRESAETSAVLAVLDATNRWLHLER